MLPLIGHTGSVTALTFSPDGERLASASRDGTIRLWDPPVERAVCTVGNKPPLAVIFDGKSRQLIVGTEDGTVAVLDPATGFLPEVIATTPGEVTGLRILPGGQKLAFTSGGRAVSRIGGLHFMSLDGKSPAPPMIREAAGVIALADLPSQRLLAWATGNREVFVQDITRQERVTIRPKYNVPSLAIAPDGKRVALATDWSVRVFDLAYKSERLNLTGHKGAVTSVAYLPGGEGIISGASDKTVRVWDASTGREVVTLTFPLNRITALAVSPDGLRAAAGDDLGGILMWDMDSW